MVSVPAAQVSVSDVVVISILLPAGVRGLIPAGSEIVIGGIVRGTRRQQCPVVNSGEWGFV
jgi:hypothetical protein